MYLKPIHIVLISAAIALGVGMGFWALQRYSVSQSGGDLLTLSGSFVITAALIGYLVWFLRKMKERGW